MNGYEAVAKILKKEGFEWLACFPSNPIIEAVAKEGIRPIVFRQERGGIMAADGYSRLMASKSNTVSSRAKAVRAPRTPSAVSHKLGLTASPCSSYPTAPATTRSASLLTSAAHRTSNTSPNSPLQSHPRTPSPRSCDAQPKLSRTDGPAR